MHTGFSFFVGGACMIGAFYLLCLHSAVHSQALLRNTGVSFPRLTSKATARTQMK